ncbi:MAG TPA: porin [Arenimonas sp.]|nr:porin [Arenimonas sp.]
MKLALNLLTLATLTALSSAAKAEITIDMIAGSEVSFEGLIQADSYWYSDDVRILSSDAVDGADTDFGMRRAEIILKGKGPGMWNWVLGYDARSDKFLDANVQYKFNGQTSVTVGQYKQPNSLEELSSTKNNDFISKAMTTNMQGMSRRVGAKIETDYGNWGGTASYFGNELTNNESPSLGSGDGYGLRGFFAPIKTDTTLLHFGLSYIDMEARTSLDQSWARLRVRPDADQSAQRLIDTGDMKDADRLKTTGLEGAFVTGPIKVQAEYMTTTVSRDLTSDFTGDSWYLYGVWNITGETWGYKGGTLTTGLPNEPGLGMWQLAARYDTADLNDGKVDFTNPLSPVVTGVMGGEESNWTLGVNWYWRSNFKLSANYVMVDSSKYSSTAKNFVDDNPDIFEVRAQFYW